jgi:hypothetical protein
MSDRNYSFESSEQLRGDIRNASDRVYSQIPSQQMQPAKSNAVRYMVVGAILCILLAIFVTYSNTQTASEIADLAADEAVADSQRAMVVSEQKAMAANRTAEILSEKLALERQANEDRILTATAARRATELEAEADAAANAAELKEIDDQSKIVAAAAAAAATKARIDADERDRIAAVKSLEAKKALVLATAKAEKAAGVAKMAAEKAAADLEVANAKAKKAAEEKEVQRIAEESERYKNGMYVHPGTPSDWKVTCTGANYKSILDVCNKTTKCDAIGLQPGNKCWHMLSRHGIGDYVPYSKYSSIIGNNLTYLGDAGCHNNKEAIIDVCKNTPRCRAAGRNASGCWHLLGTPNHKGEGTAMQHSYPGGYLSLNEFHPETLY